MVKYTFKVMTPTIIVDENQKIELKKLMRWNEYKWNQFMEQIENV